MSQPELIFRKATKDDLETLRRLLMENSLPASDLTADLVDGFIVAFKGGAIVGCAGLQRSGQSALLRSVAVDQSHRGKGVGRQLVAACSELGLSWGLQKVFLIPNDAKAHSFFLHLGCSKVNREEVPEELLMLPEFTYLCPSTHPCLRMPLDRMRKHQIMRRNISL